MTTRTLDSPFRETAWDQRLDKMLDDLKTTVVPDNERPSSSNRRDNSLLSSFRSSSRSDSRTSNRSGVEDGGLMKHHHKEYTSPDKTTRVVSDQFEYESGDPSKQYQKKVMKSTYSNYKVTGDLSSDLDALRQGPSPHIMDAARTTTEYQADNTKVVSASQKVANKLVDALSTIGPTNYYSTNSYSSSKTSNHATTGMTNGKPSYHDDEEVETINEPTGGEVRKIVWRNRFEKTYETQDGTPTISIEEEARRKREKLFQKSSSSTINYYQPPQPPQRGPVSPRQLQLQYAVYWPNFSPNISPGGQSWADPIPMPTPPQVSPKGEPGVAYVYTYGQSGSQVQHLPPLNYVTMPPGTSVPPSEGAPSPTPSGTQPIIYHYSYHYTLQPGQSLPEGVPQPPGGGNYPAQPALQLVQSSNISRDVVQRDVVPPKPSTQHIASSYDYKRSHTTASNVDRTENVNVHHHYPPGGPTINSTTINSTTSTSGSRYPPGGPSYDTPSDNSYPKPPPLTSNEPGSNRNVSITINKTSSHVTHTKDYPHGGGPSTSTPFPTPGRRSRSSSPDRYPRGPGGTIPHGTVTHVTRTSYSDSLDRMRKSPHEGLPFPDTSPIRPSENTKIPRRVDDLMTSFSDSEDGPHRGGPGDLRGMNGPRPPPPEREPLILNKTSSENTELSISERKAELKREDTKNVAGPPVYYPPGHHQLFDESMHTMTLKENKRRGMAKWRMEKASGYKESSSSSESKGGMAMVPVCLPLCCGAACVVM